MMARGAIRMRSRSSDRAAGDADEDVGGGEGVADRAGDPAPVRESRQLAACARRGRSRSGPSTPRESTTTTSPTPAATRIAAHRDAGGPRPRHDDREVREVLADDPHGVEQGGERHDRRAVLVVVEDRDVETLLEPALDLEAARRRDVLEVDAAVGRGDPRDRVDELVDGAGLHAHGHGVDAGEVLEEHRLALHDRHGGQGSDVAEAEDRGAVADDGDRVATARVDARPAWGRPRWRGRPRRRPGV